MVVKRIIRMNSLKRKAISTLSIIFIIALILLISFLGFSPFSSRVASVKTSQGSSSVTSTGTLNLTDVFKLKRINVPFKVVHLTSFNASPNKVLVTFQLPKDLSKFNYITVVWLANGSGTASYMHNGSMQNSILFSRGIYMGKFVSNQVTTKVGNITVITRYGASAWITPLPGGWNDPTVTLWQWVEFVNQLGQEVGYVIAEGTFNYVLGGTVTGINPFGSAAYAYNGYYIGSEYTDVGGQGTTFGYVINDASATICFLIASNWWVAWPGVGINSLDGTAVYEPSPYWNTGLTLGCSYTSISPPPIP
jgi:hypothetical protein